MQTLEMVGQKNSNRGFPKGHEYYAPKEQPLERQVECKNLQRLPEQLYDIGLQNTGEPPSILRTIRKGPDNEEEEENIYIDDNRLVDMLIMAEFISEFAWAHSQKKPTCRPQFRFLAQTEERFGLGSAVEAYCVKCK